MVTSIHYINEQGSECMINDKDKQEEQRQSTNAEREELQQATRRFIRSVFRSGVSVALLPVNRLPKKPQQHFYTAGREFTQGFATLLHELASGLEEMAKDTNTSTNLGENPPTKGELE
jgi:hypothetical protein